MKRFFCVALALFFCMMTALAETAPVPPQMSGSERPEGMPGMPGGERPEGMPGGFSAEPESYEAVYIVDGDAELTGEIISENKDENAVLVTDGTLTLVSARISRVSAESTGGDASSFYGVGAAVLAAGGTAQISDTEITTDAPGGTGAFAYGDGVIHISDCVINTEKNCSGGIHAAGSGTLIAENLEITTQGGSSAAIRSDRGGGTMIVEGGSYTTNGVGSPAIYSTADITVNHAELTANASEAICVEGKNSVRLTDCDLAGNMGDDAQNDNTWTVILYQSMSGDAEEGTAMFEMRGGTLHSANGGIFYTTNTKSEFTIENVEISACADCEYLLRCTGNANQRGWGTAGCNGAECSFTANDQQMNGDVIWDSVSMLDMNLCGGSILTGAVIDDESCAGEGGEGSCRLYIDESSRWIVTGDSVLTELNCAGTITDTEGNSISVIGTDGTVFVQGCSSFSITTDTYNEE